MSFWLMIALCWRGTILLCGDASPDYLHELDSYVYIQLPHHGQLDDAMAIFDELGGDAYKKQYLVSDNSGSGKTSGGSDKLVDFMKKGKYDAAHNTKNGVVELPLFSASSTLKGAEKERVCLCDLDCV